MNIHPLHGLATSVARILATRGPMSPGDMVALLAQIGYSTTTHRLIDLVIEHERATSPTPMTLRGGLICRYERPSSTACLLCGKAGAG